MGYLPDAMFNFLALLGWSLDETSEVFSKDDLVKHFTPERILANPAVFNIEKLDWFNGLYIRGMGDSALADALVPWLEDDEHGLPANARPVDRGYLARIVPLERERLKRLSEASEMLSFFFEERLEYDPALLVPKGLDADGARRALEAALATAEGADDWRVGALETAYRALAERSGVKTGQLFGAIRVAVTGRTAAPPLFDTLAVLGKERCVSRLRAALTAL